MLGRFEINVDKCIVVYTGFIKTVFEMKRSWFLISWMGNIKSRFDVVKFKTVIKKVITSHRAKETDLFKDRVKRSCHV